MMEIGVETKRLGYEYRCRVGMDEEILSVYPRNPRYPPPTETELVVEVQTNFILKPISKGEEEIVDSERFATVLMVSESVDLLCKRTTYRLEEYWFSIQESKRIIGEVFSFGKRMAAAGGERTTYRVIPIVLGIDVCTVQLEGESLDGAKDRMIKPDCLMPIKLWGLSLVPSVRPMKIDMDVRIKLIGLPKQRVEDVDKASAQMEVCPICFRPPTHGAVLTHLSCNPNHVFHNHCIVRWLILKKSCPMCRFEIPIQRNTGISESGVV